MHSHSFLITMFKLTKIPDLKGQALLKIRTIPKNKKKNLNEICFFQIDVIKVFEENFLPAFYKLQAGCLSSGLVSSPEL